MIVGFFTVLKAFGFKVKQADVCFKKSLEINDLAQWQKEMAWDIFSFQYENNDFYKNFVGDKPSSWEQIPIIRRKDLKGDFLSKLPKSINPKKLYCSNTSGSSGDPLFFARDQFNHAIVWLNIEHYYNSANISINDYQARMFGLTRKPIDRFKGRLKDWLSSRYRFNVFDLSDKALAGWVKEFKKNKYEYIYGYTNSLVCFANYLNQQNIKLVDFAPRLKGCIVTSEVCNDLDAQTIQQAFGIPVSNEYGSSEFGLMGFKTDKEWDVADHVLMIEVVDEVGKILPDGELGFITCTSLYNKATPFIRYQIGDLGSIRHENGRTKIERIMGSLNDMAILPSGKKVPGISFYFVAQELIEKGQNINEFLFRQEQNSFVFEYVANHELTSAEFALIQKGLDLNIEKGLHLIARRVDVLQRGKNGKFKHFIASH